MTLVDTSVWIASFRRKDPFRIEEVIAFDDIVTCLPVIQEVLQGFRDESAYRAARDSMLALPIVESPAGESLFLEAASLYRSARNRGITVRSAVDCLIAACALRHDLTVLHSDRDYTLISEVAPLKVRNISER
jgi:predicted nucleic acid-binding protein